MNSNKQTLRESSTFVAFALLAFYFVLAFGSLEYLRYTIDEPRHLEYGVQMLRGKSDRIGDDDSKMPVSALNALPERFADPDGHSRIDRFLRSRLAARTPTIFVSALLGLLIFFWARRWYGPFAAEVALFLFLFEPNLLAHGRLVTTDLFATAGFALSVFTLWRFLQRPNLGTVSLAAVSFGFAQVAKPSCIFLGPILAVLVMIDLGRRYLESRPPLSVCLRTLGRWGTLFSLITLLVMNLAYLGNGIGTQLKNYTFQSKTLRSFQHKTEWLGSVPLPLPYPYMQGIDRVMYRDETGDYIMPTYFMGTLHNIKNGDSGFPLYYLVVSFFKIPIVLQALFLFSIFQLVRDRKRNAWMDREIFLLVPTLLFGFYLSFMLRTQIGIRHALVLFPFLILLAARPFRNHSWALLSNKGKGGLGFALAVYLGSNLSFFPHYISYVNEFLPNRKMAYRLFADSNLDWEGNDYYLGRYRIRHPEVIVEPDGPTAGTIAISINHLLGILAPAEKFAWLRDHFKPVDHAGYSYLIFRVRQSDLASLGLREATPPRLNASGRPSVPLPPEE